MPPSCILSINHSIGIDQYIFRKSQDVSNLYLLYIQMSSQKPQEGAGIYTGPDRVNLTLNSIPC